MRGSGFCGYFEGKNTLTLFLQETGQKWMTRLEKNK